MREMPRETFGTQVGLATHNGSRELAPRAGLRKIKVRSWAPLILSLSTLLMPGCKKEDPAAVPKDQPEGALEGGASVPRPKSPDRLPAGELLEGEGEAFGFRFPKGMTFSRSRKSARAVGNVSFDALSDYVRARILVRHAELFGNKLTFPQVRIRGGQEGIFTFTLISRGSEQTLLIQDETKPPATLGLTEAERWKQAGLRPDGKLVDPNAMQ